MYFNIIIYIHAIVQSYNKFNICVYIYTYNKLITDFLQTLFLKQDKE